MVIKMGVHSFVESNINKQKNQQRDIRSKSLWKKPKSD